jgi:hypothetical protein
MEVLWHHLRVKGYIAEYIRNFEANLVGFNQKKSIDFWF